MKKQLVLLVVCMAATLPAFSAVKALKPRAVATVKTATKAPAQTCNTMCWAKEKAGNLWAWTKEKATAAHTVLAPKFETAKNFTLQHKQAAIITAAVATTAIVAGIIYHLVKKHNAKKEQRHERLHLNVIS